MMKYMMEKVMEDIIIARTNCKKNKSVIILIICYSKNEMFVVFECFVSIIEVNLSESASL